MSITSLSFTFVNTYASQAAKPAAPAEREAPAKTEARHCEEHRPASRPNRLVEAMMSALRELGFGSQPAAAPAAPATTEAAATPAAAPSAQVPVEAVTANDQAAAVAATPVADATANADAAAAATDTPAVTEAPVSVESAVHQFAHELFRALRAVGRGESSEQGGNRVDGDGGRRHHHGHHGWRREGYGDMAQRLDALAQTFAAPSAVAAASETQPNALVSTSISITFTVQDGQADASTPAPTAAAPVAAGTDAAAPAQATAAQAPAATATAGNPLLEAFSKLFGALKPESAGAPQADMADKLHLFLQSLAQAMRPETMSTIQTPQVGGLVNVTA